MQTLLLKKIANMETVKKGSQRDREQNVSDEVFNYWKISKRHGELPAMMEALDLSQPTLTNALLRGFVSSQTVADKITDYFKNRGDNAAKAPNNVKVAKKESAQREKNIKLLEKVIENLKGEL